MYSRMIETCILSPVRSAALLVVGLIYLVTASGCTGAADQSPAVDGGTTWSSADGGSGTNTQDLQFTDNPDLAGPMAPPSAVGPTGGSVNLLHMGLTGDSRPPSCEDTAHYPTAVVSAIVGYIAIRGLLAYLRRRSLYLFAIYCFIVGLIVIGLYFSGYNPASV